MALWSWELLQSGDNRGSSLYECHTYLINWWWRNISYRHIFDLKRSVLWRQSNLLGYIRRLTQNWFILCVIVLSLFHLYDIQTDISPLFWHTCRWLYTNWSIGNTNWQTQPWEAAITGLTRAQEQQRRDPICNHSAIAIIKCTFVCFFCVCIICARTFPSFSQTPERSRFLLLCWLSFPGCKLQLHLLVGLKNNIRISPGMKNKLHMFNSIQAAHQEGLHQFVTWRCELI